MNIRSQILCAWCGILCPLFMGTAMVVAGFLPPLLPSMSATDVAAFYQQNGSNIRFGMIFMQLAGALYAAFIAVISAQMRRIEHRASPALSYTQLACGAASTLLFVIPALVWATATFRPERAPESTQLLNDLGWILFVGAWSLGFVENLVIGFLVIADQKAQPIFPRWVGFLNIWIALLFLPICIMPYFKYGPFAWNGFLAFWVPASTFCIWFVVMTIYAIKAIRQQATEVHLREFH